MPKWVDTSDPASSLFPYCQLVIDSVHDLVPVVKPQSAFFEVYGSRGVAALEQTIAYAKSKGLLVLLDAKRGDIGSTSTAYAKAYLNGGMRVDALTVNPYLGVDSLEPFVAAARESGAGLFVLAMTSNPGATTFQHLAPEGRSVFLRVADMVRAFDDRVAGYSSFGIVAGATFPAEAEALRSALPRSFFLVPGMGAQGAATEALRGFFNPDGLGAIVSSSRAIMYPSAAASEAESRRVVRDAACAFVTQVNEVRP